MGHESGLHSATPLAHREADESHIALRCEIERLAAELAHAREQLAAEQTRHDQQQKMELLGRLAAGVAHDFNNLLMIVMCSSELALVRLSPTDPARPRIAEIQKAATRGATLTRRLLSFGRLTKPELRVVDVGAAVNGTSAILGRLVGDDVSIVCQSDPGSNPVRIDAGQLDHILINLVVNARDAMPEGGRILVETKTLDTSDPVCCFGTELEPGRYVTLSVTDTGCGMDPATLGRVFDAFFTTKEFGQGMGLGLSTVYAFVAEAGGGMRVASTSGLGTTFTVVLPRAEADDEQETSDAQPVRGHTSVTLLYEPHAIVRALLREVLESAGHEVIEARDRQEVLNVYRDSSRAIDLVVADAPGLRPGWGSTADFATALRPRIPTVLLVDEPIVEDIARETDGRVIVVAKPVEPESLLQRIQDALARAPR